MMADGKAPRIVLTDEERAKCLEIAKKIMEEDLRLGTHPNRGSTNHETLLAANYQGTCAELAVSKLYPGAEVIVDPCKVGPERKWRFCDHTYVVYYRDEDLQIVTTVPLNELKESPRVGFGRLLR